MNFFINTASTLMPLAFLYVLTIYLWLLVTKCILNSTELQCTQNIKLYHFDRTILSIPFCPIPFCPYTILSRTIFSFHHFQSLISALNHPLNLRYACGSPFVIVISIFLQCPPKRSRGNQLIHRRLTRAISIGSGSRSRDSDRQREGYGGMCMELIRGGRHGERG